MRLIDSISDAEGIDLYERTEGGIEIEISDDMETYFVQRVEPISPQRKREACAF
jgi:hypothetical protein